MTDTLLTLAVLAGLALVGGGGWLWRRDRRKGSLMIAAGLVLLVNIALWTTLPASPDAVTPR